MRRERVCPREKTSKGQWGERRKVHGGGQHTLTEANHI